MGQGISLVQTLYSDERLDRLLKLGLGPTDEANATERDVVTNFCRGDQVLVATPDSFE